MILLLGCRQYLRHNCGRYVKAAVCAHLFDKGLEAGNETELLGAQQDSESAGYLEAQALCNGSGGGVIEQNHSLQSIDCKANRLSLSGIDFITKHCKDAILLRIRPY